MNFLESIDIKGFWGDKNVSLKFHEDVNFLIGPNGSGKTTIINLISAALSADSQALSRINFDQIIIKLKTIGKNKKPVISVQKINDGASSEIIYKISQSTTEEPVDFELSAGRWGDHYSRLMHERYIQQAGVRRPFYDEKESTLYEELAKLVRVTWLSVHRGASPFKQRDEENLESAVDEKVRDISRNFANYFSLLGARANRESRLFQEFIFLSLLYKKRSGSILLNINIDIESERSQLEQIFAELGMPPQRFRARVKQHFDAVEGARDKLTREGEGVALEMHEFSAIMDSARVHEVVDEWTKLQDRHKEIFSPKSRFEQLINELFVRKKLEFNDRNEPVIITQSGKKFGPNVLSSGEKQLFILFGEALLHENKPAVFIADEPELSLHVSWQAELIKNMRSLNPFAQMIIATHSPDIVGGFQDRLIRVEDRIS